MKRISTLRVVTYNIWHGLTGRGILRTTPYEAIGEQEKRFKRILRALLKLKESGVSLIGLQEVSPMRSAARAIRSTLDWHEHHQVCNSGMKCGIGIPVNLCEGVMTTAAPELQLRKHSAIKLPSGFHGFNRDWISFQLGEHRYALFSEISFGSKRILVVNTHLHHCFGEDPITRAALQSSDLAASDRESLEQYFRAGSKTRMEQITTILGTLEKHSERDVILLGDLNAIPGSSELEIIRKAGFGGSESNELLTYNATLNPLARVEGPNDLAGSFASENSQITSLFSALNRTPRQLDHIFCRGLIRIANVALATTEPGLSDHFGLMAEIQIGN